MDNVRISTFSIRDFRSVKLAQCLNVPRLMVIAGPNGAGKSSLLYQLRAVNGRENVLYVGPHRAARRQTVRQRNILGPSLVFESLLTRDDARPYDGVELLTGLRDPWSNDDSANYLKHSLCQIEVERQQAIAARYDSDGELKRDSFLEPWMPLRELTKNLLPHLEFARIDNSNREQIRCLWRVHGKTEVDYDDLSSGEKSIIQIFYPLVEHRIRGLLDAIKHGPPPAARPEICVLIDEPELHLHPVLQVKVFDYLRVLCAEGGIQVIVASHSPTIVEQATFDELYLLRPPELANDDNQLVPVATDEARLATLRELFGSTSNITAMQPVIVVEGIGEEATAKVMPDRKLFRAANKQFDSVIVVPGGGEAECIKLVDAMNGALPSISARLKAVALLDSDVDRVPTPGVFRLPVSMIENLILDPDIIWRTIQSVYEKAGLLSQVDVENALDAILDSMQSRERERRAKHYLGAMTFRPESPVVECADQVAAFRTKLDAAYSAQAITDALARAQAEVAALKDTKQRRERFHGKDVVDEFFKRHLHSTGLAKGIFKFEAMRHASERKSVKAFFDSFFGLVMAPPGIAPPGPSATSGIVDTE